MRARSQEPTARHRAFRDKLIEALREFSDVPADEMLALASHMVGQLVALQDQTKFTPETAMEIVARNIEIGNAEVIDDLRSAVGGRA